MINYLPFLIATPALALAGCGTHTTSGQHFGPTQPSCIIGCRSSIEANNAHPNGVINILPKLETR